MLVALDGNGTRTLGENAVRSEPYFCPQCHDDMVFKSGPIVVWHFAHRRHSTCDWNAGETLRHVQMKYLVGKLFPGAEIEVRVPPYHCADLILPGKIVVECQATPLPLDDWYTRTADYNEAGYAILWLWDSRLVTRSLAGEETRISATIRQCHKASFGRVYLLDDAGQVLACHLYPADIRYTDFGVYYPKTIRKPSYRRIDRPVPAVFFGSEGDALVGLGDGIWWKPRDGDE